MEKELIHFLPRVRSEAEINQIIANAMPADWPEDEPPYQSVEGWIFEKERAYDRVKREMINRNCANWFLYMGDWTGEPRYMIVADRLMEIERGE